MGFACDVPCYRTEDARLARLFEVVLNADTGRLSLSMGLSLSPRAPVRLPGFSRSAFPNYRPLAVKFLRSPPGVYL